MYVEASELQRHVDATTVTRATAETVAVPQSATPVTTPESCCGPASANAHSGFTTCRRIIRSCTTNLYGLSSGSRAVGLRL